MTPKKGKSADCLTLDVQVCDRDVSLPIITLSNGRKVAYFDAFDHPSLCELFALKWSERTLDTFDHIVAPEVKAIPLAQQLSICTGKPYIIARKSAVNPSDALTSGLFQAYTSSNAIELFLATAKAEALKGKRVLIVDDVWTTGSTAAAVQSLVTKAGGVVVGCAVVFLEGDQQPREDLLWLGRLPTLDGCCTSEPEFKHAAMYLPDDQPIVYAAISKHSFCYRVLISNYILEQGCAPVNPFMNFDFGFFGLQTKDTVISANNSLVRRSDEVWAFGPISDGGLAELLRAKALGKPLKYFAINKDWSIVEITPDHAEMEEAELFPVFKAMLS